MKYYRVVEWNSSEGLNVLTVSLESFEEALAIKNTEYYRKYHSDAFVIEMLFGSKED